MTMPAQPNRTGRKLIAEAEALREMRAHATISVSTAATLMGVGLERMRAAAARGDVAVVRLGPETRVASAPLLAALGLGAEPAGETEGAPS